MQYCAKCRISIRGDKKCCPLCQGQLSGEPEDPAFPVIPVKRSRMTVFRVALFCFIAFEVAMCVLMFLLAYSGLKVDGVIAPMVAALIAITDIALIMYYRRNPLHLVIGEIYVALIVVFLVDLITGFQRWSVIWVLPFAFVGLMIITAAIGKGMGLRPRGYILYLFFHLILSLGVQLIFFLTGLNPMPFPAVISMAFCIVFFAGMMIFNQRVFEGEAEKFFNV